MTHIELPRALEDYFAYAETDPTRTGRRFSISMPYFEGARLDRLQWWYHLSREQEQRLGDTTLQSLREQATARFRRHIERWLENSGRRLHGDEPIPRIGLLEVAAAPAPVVPADVSAPAAEVSEPATPNDAAGNVLPWPTEKVANG
jgi:hypothetical protein